MIRIFIVGFVACIAFSGCSKPAEPEQATTEHAAQEYDAHDEPAQNGATLDRSVGLQFRNEYPTDAKVTIKYQGEDESVSIVSHCETFWIGAEGKKLENVLVESEGYTSQNFGQVEVDRIFGLEDHFGKKTIWIISKSGIWPPKEGEETCSQAGD